MRVSKCTCGPKQWPVQPEEPMTWPCDTLAPDVEWTEMAGFPLAGTYWVASDTILPLRSSGTCP